MLVDHAGDSLVHEPQVLLLFVQARLLGDSGRDLLRVASLDLQSGQLKVLLARIVFSLVRGSAGGVRLVSLLVRQEPRGQQRSHTSGRFGPCAGRS